MSTPESLDPKTVKRLWDQNQHKSQDKTSQSHKKKGTENIAQVIVDGIQDSVISDESETQSFASSNHEETLCWVNYGKEFIIQYNDLIKNSNGKIGEKKAKGIIYDKILEHLNIREGRSKEMGLQLPEISRKTLCKKTQKAVRTYKLFEKIGMDQIKYLKAYSANSISELTKIIDTRRQNHTTEIVSTLPETELNAFSEKVSLEKLSETISEESTEGSQESVSNKPRETEPRSSTHPNKNCLYQYDIKHGMNPEKFAVITEAEKKRWDGECFHEDLKRDIRFYRSGIERKEDPRKYREFLTDRERLVGEELLRRYYD
ncbi:12690_t:CDS:2 [Acaulospora colombiana]|uniref:12690_t:CDS:1 n=1 Tax=Acaulospora colombiana TaxID=27376 RepID=A0ACA9LB70_9GLOM|nr:12690_t:CDS:2 [Acaulospora colombiana]